MTQPATSVAQAQIRAERIQCMAHQNERTGQWIGECEPLGVVLEANDLGELHSLFNEAINLLFADLSEDGELADFLEARGWEDASEFSDSVPWELIATGVAGGSARSVT